MRENNPLARVEKAMETPTGAGASRVVNITFGIVVTVLLSLLLANSVRGMNLAEKAIEHNSQQDKDITSLQIRQEAIKQVTDEQVQTLQAISIQMTRMQDDIDHYMKPKGRDR